MKEFIQGMGQKLDAIFGRTFKASKFRSLSNLAISRLAVFKNQRQVKCNQARSDTVQLLEQGHHDRALLRVEHVIKEQNMLHVYVMMEGYCNLLVERMHLIEQERVCPDELLEAISSLLFASSRCGDFPELKEIRAILTSRYGKEFAARAVELRNNCGVNHKMITKLSTRQPDLEARMKVLKEIASENSIVLQLDEGSSSIEEKLDVGKKQSHPEQSTNSGSSNQVHNLQISTDTIERDGFSDSVEARKKYRDVADAAQAAFESAAHAAEAARAAMELSRSDPHDPDYQNSPDNRGKKVFDTNEPSKLEPESENQESCNENEDAEMKAKDAAEQEGSESTSSSYSAEKKLKVATMSLDTEDLAKQFERDIIFDESDNETSHLNSNVKSSNLDGENSNKQIPTTIQGSLEVDSKVGYSTTHAAEGSGIQNSWHLNRKMGPISVRTRQVLGY